MLKINRNFVRTISFFISVWIAIYTYPCFAYAATTDWSIGSEVRSDSFNICDEPPGLAKVGNTVYFITADVYQGPQNPWVVYSGTSADNLVLQYTGNRNNFPDDYGSAANGNRFWCTGLWVDSGDNNKWYTLVHVEYNYQVVGNGGNWPMRRIGYATSTDQGYNWNWGGYILTADTNDTDWKAGAGGIFNRGLGDPRLFVDTAGGYIYAYYFHNWLNTNNGAWYSDTRAARCTISSKMAPGSWEKFYNGSWSQPGLGGHDSQIFANSINGFVFYNSYLKEYVAMGQKADSSGFAVQFLTCTDMSKQNWSQPERFRDGQLGYYDWVWDSNSGSTFSVGQTFRYYTSKINIDNWYTRYFPVTLNQSESSDNIEYFNSDGLPQIDLPDYDTRMSGLPASALREDFNGSTLSGWTKVSGNGTFKIDSNTLLASAGSSSTLYLDDSSQSYENGYMAFSFNSAMDVGFDAIFRYIDSSHYAAIFCRNGQIGWENGSGTSGTLASVETLDSSFYHRLEITYSSDKLFIQLDYKPIYQGTVAGLPTDAGKLGLRVDANADVHVDDWFQYSAAPFSAAATSPESSSSQSASDNISSKTDDISSKLDTGLSSGNASVASDSLSSNLPASDVPSSSGNNSADSISIGILIGIIVAAILVVGKLLILYKKFLKKKK